jgi:type I restriction enzyme, S subunit
LLPKGSLILSNSGTVCIPKFLGAEACIHDGFVSFLGLPKEISKEFLFYYFQYLRPYIVQKHKQGITQVNLNIEIVSDFDLNLPPTNEQNRIVEKIEELFSDLDQGIESLKTAQKQLKVYRQAVLKRAFEGKLTEEWRKQHTHDSLVILNETQWSEESQTDANDRDSSLRVHSAQNDTRRLTGETLLAQIKADEKTAISNS